MEKQYTIINGELYHYGIPGMRWGHRKRVPSADSDEVKTIRKKTVEEMSNQELQKANKRLELEEKYNGFAQRRNVGRKIVNTVIKASGTITALAGAYTVYKSVGKKVIDRIGSMGILQAGNNIAKKI